MERAGLSVVGDIFSRFGHVSIEWIKNRYSEKGVVFCKIKPNCAGIYYNISGEPL